MFVGTFTAGEVEFDFAAGQLRIAREGHTRKFVQAVEHRTFSGREALRRGQRVLYVTERCVFRLVAQGEEGALELIELAPGMDLERDVLALMEFRPLISPQLRSMDAALFAEGALNLRERLLATPLAERFELDPAHRMLFINFEGLAVDEEDDIAAIEQHVRQLLQGAQGRVAVVVNYDNCSILPTLIDAYSAMVKRLSDQYYSRVTRYGTGGFLKAKLEAQRG